MQANGRRLTLHPFNLEILEHRALKDTARQVGGSLHSAACSSEVGCLLQEFNRQLQDAGQNDQLTAMRDIAFELAAPAGELRRQRGSGSHKVSPNATMTVLLNLLSKESGPFVEAGHGMPLHA